MAHSERVLLICAVMKIVLSQNNTSISVVPTKNVKYFQVPTSKEPIMSWMEIQKGIFPETTEIKTDVSLGEPLTIYIFLMDKSNFYDIKVSSCWAHDNESIDLSRHVLKLDAVGPKGYAVLGDWSRHQVDLGGMIKRLLYNKFNSFRFPDKHVLFVKCNVEICFKSCGVSIKQQDNTSTEVDNNANIAYK